MTTTTTKDPIDILSHALFLSDLPRFSIKTTELNSGERLHLPPFNVEIEAFHTRLIINKINCERHELIYVACDAILSELYPDFHDPRTTPIQCLSGLETTR